VLLDHSRYEAEFGAETDLLGESAVATGADRAVPTCPEWTVRDLVTHVGTGHRWSAGIIEQRLTAPVPLTTVPAPDDPREWPSWLRAGADRLIAAVRDAGPHGEVWTWQADPGAGFWLRRMLHDELIHRFDLEIARGELGEVAPDLAADGVRDWLDTAMTLSTPDGPFAGMAGEPATLVLRATDANRAWRLQRTPDGVTWTDGEGAGQVYVSGPARDLLLVLNRRLDRDRLDIHGDKALFAQMLEHSVF
jgi:uncharacterized protein (TIGR03083 family)